MGWTLISLVKCCSESDDLWNMNSWGNTLRIQPNVIETLRGYMMLICHGKVNRFGRRGNGNWIRYTEDTTCGMQEMGDVDPLFLASPAGNPPNSVKWKLSIKELTVKFFLEISVESQVWVLDNVFNIEQRKDR